MGTLLGIFFGFIAWFLTRYLLAFPVWGDEAFLLLNYRTRGFADLFGPIDNCQIAPLLFHVAELAVYKWLGTSEIAIRLPAFDLVGKQSEHPLALGEMRGELLGPPPVGERDQHGQPPVCHLIHVSQKGGRELEFA